MAVWLLWSLVRKLNDKHRMETGFLSPSITQLQSYDVREKLMQSTQDNLYARFEMLKK